MHHKFCLIDVLTNENKIDLDRSASHGVLINGSLNWTKNVSLSAESNWKSSYYSIILPFFAGCKPKL